MGRSPDVLRGPAEFQKRGWPQSKREGRANNLIKSQHCTLTKSGGHSSLEQQAMGQWQLSRIKLVVDEGFVAFASATMLPGQFAVRQSCVCWRKRAECENCRGRVGVRAATDKGTCKV